MPDSRKRPPSLILASSSPYRRELLERLRIRLRIPFDVAVPAIDETPLAGETPEITALRLSEAKAPCGRHRWSRARDRFRPGRNV